MLLMGQSTISMKLHHQPEIIWGNKSWPIRGITRHQSMGPQGLSVLYLYAASVAKHPGALMVRSCDPSHQELEGKWDFMGFHGIYHGIPSGNL